MILLTGRRESVRRHTEKLLRKHGVGGYRHLLMRPDGDFRTGTIVKPELLEQFGIVPDLVFEDWASMIDYWRSKGIACFQIAAGKF